MKENDFICFKVGYESTVAAGSRSTMDDCKQARKSYLQADIARQLTRIADGMLASEDVQLEKEMQEATAPDANIRFEILAKAFFYDTKMMAPGKSIAAAENPPYTEKDRFDAWHKWLKENDVPEPPAPDALVEAVKRISRDISSEYLLDMDRKDIVDRWCNKEITHSDLIFEALKVALADHEKAVEQRNRKEARNDANNMLLDKGEFPDTEAVDGN